VKVKSFGTDGKTGRSSKDKVQEVCMVDFLAFSVKMWTDKTCIKKEDRYCVMFVIILKSVRDNVNNCFTKFYEQGPTSEWTADQKAGGVRNSPKIEKFENRNTCL
jgi:hypothetical protein